MTGSAMQRGLGMMSFYAVETHSRGYFSVMWQTLRTCVCLQESWPGKSADLILSGTRQGQSLTCTGGLKVVAQACASDVGSGSAAGEGPSILMQQLDQTASQT